MICILRRLRIFAGIREDNPGGCFGFAQELPENNGGDEDKEEIKMEMEELIPIVGKLAGKYTAYESTSITYEKAEQLMGAVLYCIREIQQTDREGAVLSGVESAEQLYDAGAVLVVKKTKEALALYNRMLPEFISYGNQFLQDAFTRELPEFFQWYDNLYEPQNTVVTLDYPVLKDLSGYTGIDRIYEFIRCIYMEQKFLRMFPEEYVINTLKSYNREYEETPDNICGIVFMAATGHPFPSMEDIAIHLKCDRVDI